MRKVCVCAAAVLLLSIGSLRAASSPSVINIPHAIVPTDAVPNTSSVGFVATGVLIGFTDPDHIVPCFDCVLGPDIETLLMAVPYGSAFEGQTITVMVLSDDLFYSGTVAFSFEMKTSPTASPTVSQSFEYSVYPGVWLASFPIAAPAAGQYIVEGEVSAGEGLSQHTKVSSTLIVGRNQL